MLQGLKNPALRAVATKKSVSQNRQTAFPRRMLSPTIDYTPKNGREPQAVPYKIPRPEWNKISL